MLLYRQRLDSEQIKNEIDFFHSWITNPITIERYQKTIGALFNGEEYIQELINNMEYVELPLSNEGKTKFIELLRSNGNYNDTDIKKELKRLKRYKYSGGFGKTFDKPSGMIFALLNASGILVHEFSHKINSPTTQGKEFLKNHHNNNHSNLQHKHKQTKITMRDGVLLMTLGTILIMSYLGTIFGITWFMGTAINFYLNRDNDLRILYLFKPEEIHSRTMEIRFHLQKKPENEIIWEEIEQLLSKQDCSENIKKFINTLKTKKIQEYFVEYINTIY